MGSTRAVSGGRLIKDFGLPGHPHRDRADLADLQKDGSKPLFTDSTVVVRRTGKRHRHTRAADAGWLRRSGLEPARTAARSADYQNERSNRRMTYPMLTKWRRWTVVDLAFICSIWLVCGDEIALNLAFCSSSSIS